MAITPFIEQLNALIEPVVTRLGLELLGCEYLPGKKSAIVRVYLDSAQGITLDDCAAASEQIGAVLDVADSIAGHYNLEVSSPGWDRPLFTLAHFQRFVGAKAKLKTRIAIDGRKRFTGVISKVDNELIELHDGVTEWQIPFRDIDKANLVPEGEEQTTRH